MIVMGSKTIQFCKCSSWPQFGVLSSIRKNYRVNRFIHLYVLRRFVVAEKQGYPIAVFCQFHNSLEWTVWETQKVKKEVSWKQCIAILLLPFSLPIHQFLQKFTLGWFLVQRATSILQSSKKRRVKLGSKVWIAFMVSGKKMKTASITTFRSYKSVSSAGVFIA